MDIPFHPQVIHFPIALSVLIPLLSLGILIAWWKNFFSRRAWILAAILQLMLVATSFGAMRTGEFDEKRVKKVVAHEHIEEHEELAELFLWSTAIVALPFLATLFLKQSKLALSAAAISILGSFFVLFLAYRTGEAGGRLVYIHGAASAFSATPPATPPAAPRTPSTNSDDD